MWHICLYIGVKIFSAYGCTYGSTRGSTRGPRGPKKSDGRTENLKRAFSTSTVIFSAKNGPKLKNLTFLESAVREFSENGFGSKKN